MRKNSFAIVLIRIATCLTGLAILGCVSTPTAQGFDPDKAIRALSYKYVGLNISQMAAAYGAPARSMPLSGQTVYTWDYTTSNLRCQLDAYAGSDGILVNLGYSGNNGACQVLLPRGL